MLDVARVQVRPVERELLRESLAVLRQQSAAKVEPRQRVLLRDARLRGVATWTRYSDCRGISVGGAKIEWRRREGGQGVSTWAGSAARRAGAGAGSRRGWAPPVAWH